MSERYTRKDAERAFQRLATACGKRVSKGWPRGADGTLRADVGAWYLDYAAIYGGYVVAELANEGGGESRPFGDQRVSAREFCDRVRFAITALAESEDAS